MSESEGMRDVGVDPAVGGGPVAEAVTAAQVDPAITAEAQAAVARVMARATPEQTGIVIATAEPLDAPVVVPPQPDLGSREASVMEHLKAWVRAELALLQAGLVLASRVEKNP